MQGFRAYDLSSSPNSTVSPWVSPWISVTLISTTGLILNLTYVTGSLCGWRWQRMGTCLVKQTSQ